MAVDLDLSQFHGLFFEESAEGLTAMESGLLNLRTDAPDLEIINMVFRAAHSIKGGAGTFGFNEVAHFTHILETLLDEMRDRKRGVTQELIDLLLESVDGLRYMLDSSKNGRATDMQRMRALEQRLTTLPREAHNEGEARWQIKFTPRRHLLKTGNDPYRIFRELQSTGGLTVKVNAQRLPNLAELDPEEIHLDWELYKKAGETTEASIRELFAWVEGDCDLQVALLGERRHMVERRKGREPEGGEAEAETAGKGHEQASIRINIEKIDGLINLVGELVITQSILNRIASDHAVDSRAEKLKWVVGLLERNTSELQDHAMRIRMLPIDFTFNRLPRLVRDLSRSLGKQVELKISGNSTEVDKTVLEKISDPLVHLIRNAVDHGIEKPEDRLAADKPAQGLIEISAHQEGGNIIIKISDDGAGLNPERILAKARERGLVAEHEELTPMEVQNLIFQPGFSTASEVSDISGRGVGMDVVRRNITDLGGHIELMSVPGKGSIFNIKLPLTLAILDGQLIRIGREVFIVPLLNIVESIQPRKAHALEVTGQNEVYRFRDQYIPVIRLYQCFTIPTEIRELPQGLLVVVEAGEQRAALFVDEVLGQQQVVIKSLEANYQQVAGLSGATILGDGTVAMIIDVPGLIHMLRAKKAVRAVV
ncbi:MAG TPA: chemotaxis protein CheA [Gammaproteobacteria bacterium]|nr:chemotaxis protein CheA [Gammaproteobacteria bacterium]